MKQLGRPPKQSWDPCGVPNCQMSTREGAKGFCPRHYHQFHLGLIDQSGTETGKRVYLFRKGAPCQECGKPSVGRGLCSLHYQRQQRVSRGTPPRVLGAPCKLCQKNHFAKGFCQTHYAQLQRGIIDGTGEPLRPMKRIPKLEPGAACRQEECSNPARTRGWCNKHYLQFRAGILDEHGMQLRAPEITGRPARGWRTVQRGYIKKMSKGHPYADRDGYVLEHRLVMEQKIGRYLEPEELVHHINGVRDDNRVENLQLTTRKSHIPGHEHPRVSAAKTLLQDPALPDTLRVELEKLVK